MEVCTFFLFFILLGKPFFRYKILKSFSAKDADQIAEIAFSITAQIRRYLGLQFIISGTTGILVWFALTMIGVYFSVTWGALAFFVNFITAVGSICAVDDTTGDGQRYRPQSFGRPAESKPGRRSAIAFVFRLAVGHCRRTALGTHCSGTENCLREYQYLSYHQCVDGFRQGLSAGVHKSQQRNS